MPGKVKWASSSVSRVRAVKSADASAAVYASGTARSLRVAAAGPEIFFDPASNDCQFTGGSGGGPTVSLGHPVVATKRLTAIAQLNSIRIRFSSFRAFAQYAHAA